MNLSSQRDGDMSQRVSFTDVPEEIRCLIIDELSIHDKALFARTSKSINAYIAPSLYEKMYTRIGTRQDTDGLVQLLRKRPNIVPLIQVLVIDEYHPRHTRRLLSIEMPNLNCLLVQHASDSIEHVSEREKRALNRNLVEQPKLNQFVLWAPFTCILSKQDACLFRQPDLFRLRFSNIDFSDFESANDKSLIHTSLRELNIEDSPCSTKALKRLITPARCLTSIRLSKLRGPFPVSEQELLPILSHTAETLKILKLHWTFHPTVRDYGFDLSTFRAMRLLRIEPGLLLGPHGHNLSTYTSSAHPHLADLIRSRIPPNLKLLFLESVTIPVPPAPDLRQIIFERDREFMRCLLERKAEVAPKLTRLYMYYQENMSGAGELCKIAEAIGVEMSGLYAFEDPNVSWSWLDEDEDAIESSGKYLTEI
ncbi:MAG: hypothetical protein Q9202_006102 [Teloschistes flavicans]